MGKSPAFAHDESDIAIWESGSVITYLLETYDTNFALLYPLPGTATKAERAKFLQSQQSIVASVCIRTFKKKSKMKTMLIMPRTNGEPCWLPHGVKMSAVDLLTAKPLNKANSLGMLADFPTLNALFQNIRCMLSFLRPTMRHTLLLGWNFN
jgi:hypothetical protein